MLTFSFLIIYLTSKIKEISLSKISFCGALGRGEALNTAVLTERWKAEPPEHFFSTTVLTIPFLFCKTTT
jgi:hypothetical protein